jgi:hypothetical protein
MSLPYDVTRCMGARHSWADAEQCPHRQQCKRFLALADTTEDRPISRVQWACSDAFEFRLPVGGD